MSASESEESGIQIRIVLKLAGSVEENEQNSLLRVPTEPIAVPADTGRKGLSAVINHLLERTGDEVIPFDCIVGSSNRLLRTGLEREARRLGLSLEEALPVTYFIAQRAPEASGESEKGDDWIDSLCFFEGNLFAGCYDGSLLCYSSKDNKSTSPISLHRPTKMTSLHSGPIKTLSASKVDNTTTLVASGSMDQTLKLVRYKKGSPLSVLAECHEGHFASVTSLDFSRHMLASGDWNGGLCIWDASEAMQNNDMANESPSNKKAKTASDNTKATVDKTAFQISPKTQIRAHVSALSGISWGNHNAENVSSSLITGSWDHGIKVWDVERADCLLTLNGAKVVSCLDTSYFSEGIVATGHPDHTIRLWDTRIDPKNDDVTRLNDSSFRTSHKAWVSSVQWSPHTPFHLASTSHDGTMKLWDIRSPIPLYTTRAFPQKEKGLCLAYGPSSREGTNLFAAGTDCRVKQFQCRIPMNQ